MASFDSERNCYVVRIVYDGPGFAGKTTNLKRISEIIPPNRRSELVTPAELKGRTMFFDWLEIDGPRELGFAVKLQLISVPGQEQRNYRRRPLVEMADVVVFVCDSTPAQIPDSLRVFTRLRSMMKKRKTPLELVVQANKQDVEGALTPEQVRKRLKLAAETMVLPAVASQTKKGGQGIRETLALAMRLGIEQIDDAAMAPLVQEFQNADNLFDHALSFEDNPHSDEPVDVEELYIDAEDVDLGAGHVAAHLEASSLNALESRARRAARAVDAKEAASATKKSSTDKPSAAGARNRAG